MSIEELLGMRARPIAELRSHVPQRQQMSFSMIFFSDVRRHVSDAEKYAFMAELSVFADDEGFQAIYMPERHFGEFGSIYANPAITAAFLIPQTKRIRFRTAGIVLPLHHPAEVVENWAMNDVLSNGRVDLGFASGWSRDDFILAREEYERRKVITRERVKQVQRLWRGEALEFAGPGDAFVSVKVQPKPIQKEVQIWMLTLNSNEGFRYAGSEGLNVFTMLQGRSIEELSDSVKLYREARATAGLDPAAGKVSLMLHTLVGESVEEVRAAVEEPFKEYIKASMDAHLASVSAQGSVDVLAMTEREKNQMLQYAYQRYVCNASLFGGMGEACEMVDRAIRAGVDEIACLMDFGVDYDCVRASLPQLRKLVHKYS